jgi:hypothetical protein
VVVEGLCSGEGEAPSSLVPRRGFSREGQGDNQKARGETEGSGCVGSERKESREKGKSRPLSVEGEVGGSWRRR